VITSAWAAQTNVNLLVPGFTVRELPVRLSNINNLRFAPDGRLTALGYDGRVHLLRDSDGDGLEDRFEVFWDQPTLSVPVGMAWSTRGLYVSSKGKVSLLRDVDGDGRGDSEEVIATGWPPTDVGSGGVDATAVTLDAEGNVYFGLLVADYSNAYRLRKRKDLKPEEKAWLAARGQPAEGDAEEEISLYDIHSPRGTIQKWNAQTKHLETLATGIRVPYTLAFNPAGDLFLTDQEGETWMPNGNPLDELNHIIAGRNYGFPPPHPKWLPNLVSELPVVAFGPQHQSTCGFVFNQPRGPINRQSAIHNGQSTPLPASPAQGLFGPSWWSGDAIVTGESRGKLWRVRLVKTPQGYAGKPFLFARLNMLVTDVAISPQGELYVSCHSGPPDWGTGPKGEGRLFKMSYTDSQAPQPVLAWRESAMEARVAFDRPIDPAITNRLPEHRLEAGEFVSAADRFEVLKPPYAVAKQQAAAPRERIAVRALRLLEAGRVLALETDAVLRDGWNHALTLPGVRAPGVSALPATVDVEFDTAGAGAEFRWNAGQLELASVRRARVPAPKTEAAPLPSPGGDWQRGKALFASEQTQCAKCHRVRGEGGLAGPDLSNLVARDAASVLRDIREPSASIHPDYTGYTVALRDGEALSGFVRAQDPDALTVLGVDGRETRARRADVRELRASSVSLMPEGLLDALSEAEVKDLLTFLVTEPPPKPKAAAAPPKRKKEPPPPRSRAEVEALLAVGRDTTPPAPLRPLELVLVASKQDHGPGEHDYPWWQTNWSKLLGQSEKVSMSTAWEWPSDAQFSHASVLVFYFWNHDWNPKRYAQLDQFLARGGGLVILHAACIADKEPEPLAERLGLSAQPVRTKYRHGPLDLKMVAPNDHPITRGLPPTIHFVDETYWPMIGDTTKVEVLATAEEEGKPWPMVWTFTKGRGRVFGSILGHYSWTYDDAFFRALILRGLAWAAGEPTARFDALVTR
jgi:putative heme-binding domain-containing protein